MNVREMETIRFLEDGKQYDGTVLGRCDEYFWLLVPELNSVYVGNPSTNIFEHSGVKYVRVYDLRRRVSDMFDEHGAFCSDVFQYAEAPERMIALLRTYKLLIAP